MSQFPRDEFDKVPESSARQGVHRARITPPRIGGLGLVLLAGAVALMVGAVAFFILPRLGLDFVRPPAGATATTSAAGPTATATAGTAIATAAASPAPGDTGTNAGTARSAATPTAEPDSSARPTVTPTAQPVDRTQPVNVLNGAGITGLGANVAARLGAQGWTTGQVANWGGQPVQTSIIFYNGADQLANAQELSRLLNVPTLVESSQVSPNVTVVLGPGFQ